jgi:HlyD family secretion protein
MNRTRNSIIVIVALLAVVGAAVWAGHRDTSSAIPAKVQKVAYSTFTVTLTEDGVVVNPTTATVPTLVAGNIGQIFVKAGTHVNAGELMATIENPTLNYNAASSQADYTNAVANVSTARVDEQNARVQYQAQVATNKSALDEALRVYNADEALLQQKAIARSQVDSDKAKLDQAQVAYDQAVAQLRLGAVSGYGMDSVQAAQADAEKTKIVNAQNQDQVALTRIVAPISGIVQTVTTQTSDTLRSLQSGDPVTEGQALFTIASDDRYVVRAQVDEQDIINVRLGQRANVTGQDFPNKTIVGHVSYISPVAQKSTDASSTAKQILTTISLDSSPAFLKDGMSADIDIVTTSIPHAIVVPNDAIGKDGTHSYVYVVQKGIVAKRTISTGLVGDTTTVVTAGLNAGETIVTSKDPQIKPGVRVTPLPSSSPPVAM